MLDTQMVRLRSGTTTDATSDPTPSANPSAPPAPDTDTGAGCNSGARCGYEVDAADVDAEQKVEAVPEEVN